MLWLTFYDGHIIIDSSPNTDLCFLSGSKMVGWQLCSNASYPLPATGFSLPPPGPIHLSLRLLKLDRGLHYYLLEAAYSLLPQVQENTKAYWWVSSLRWFMSISLCEIYKTIIWCKWCQGFKEYDCRLVCVLSLSSLTVAHIVPTCVSERHLAPQRGLRPPPPGHTSVLHPQGHVSGPDLQPSQTAAEDHPPSENHPHTRSVTDNKNLDFCLGLMLKMCCFLRTTWTREECKVRKAGAVDWWRSLLHHGECWDFL